MKRWPSSTSTLRTGHRPLYALACTVLLACILAYSVALAGPLLFDDVPNLTANHFLHINGRIFDDWRVAIQSSDAGVLHRPLAMFTFTLNYVVSGGFFAASLKATNLVIHLLNAVLVFFFCQTVLRAPALKNPHLNSYQSQVVALLAASIWLLHPLHVSTVLYAVQRMAQLSTLFTLAGLLVFCAIGCAGRSRVPRRGSLLRPRLVVAVSSALAALLARKTVRCYRG